MGYLNTICRILIVALICFVLLGAAGQQPCLYVVNTLSDDLSVINTANGGITHIPLGARGYHIAFAPRHDYALVTATSQVAPVAQSGGAGNKTEFSGLLVIDVTQARVCGAIPMALSPLSRVHIHPAGKQAFVVTAAGPGNRNLVRGQVLMVDLQHSVVTGVVNIGLNPLDSVMTPNGTRLYTADWGSKSISIIDLASGRLFDSIPLGANPARVLALSPSGDTLYAGFEHAPAYVGLLNAPNMNATQLAPQNQAIPQMVHADESLLWAFNTNNGTVGKYTIPGLQKVLALAVSPDGRRVYLYGRISSGVATNLQPRQQQAQNTENDELLAFDVVEKRVVGRYGNFSGLASVEVSPDGGQLYLIGTPGDPGQEAALRAKNAQRFAQRNNTRGNNSSNVIGENNLANNTDVSGIIDDLSQLHKTVTVLDAATGRQLTVYTVGSLPQGCAWLP